MGITRVISSEPLTDAEATSWAPAVSQRLATSLAGRARYLLELLRGDGAGFDGDVGTPLNPQGQLGVDRSGPPWGSAHQHPMWLYEYEPAAEIFGEVPLAELTAVGQQVTVFADFFVRPHYVAPRVPYSRAYLTWGITRTGSAGTVAAKATIYGIDDEASTPSQTLTTSSSTTGNVTAFGYVAPGLNTLRLVIEATTVPAGCVIRIDALSLGQIANRSH